MTESLLPVGASIILFILIFGLAVYFLVSSSIKIRKNNLLTRIQEQRILELTKKTDKKRVILDKLSKKIKRVGRKLGRISKVKELKKDLREEHKKNYELGMSIKRLEHNLKVKKASQPTEKAQSPISKKADNNQTDKIKQRFPNLPKNHLERIEVERQIARTLMKNNGGSFHISQILQSVERIYPKHIEPNIRITLFNEIKSWIERDPLCKAVKTAGSVQHYTFI